MDNLLEQANADLKKIGTFIEGGDGDFGTAKIDSSNNTLALTIQNNTTAVQTASLFNFSESLFTGVQNPPPSVFGGLGSFIFGFVIQSALCVPNNTIYSISSISDVVEVYDYNSNSISTIIALPIGSNPLSIAYNSITNEMYVYNFVTADIIRINCNTNTIVGAPIPLGFAPTTNVLYFNSIKNSIYVFDGFNPVIYEIDCVTNTIVYGPFIPPFQCTSATFNPNLNVFYLSDVSTNSILVWDCVTNTVTSSTPTTLFIIYGSAICTANNTLYVSDLTGSQFVIYDINTNTLIGAPIPYISIGASVYFIIYNNINNLLYGINSFTGTLITIDPTNNSQTATLSINSSNYIYNTNNNSVFITDGAGNYINYLPISPPIPTVTYSGGITPATIYNDTQTKPFIIKGIKMIVSDIQQLNNNFVISNKSYTGAADTIQWQPLNYVSPTTLFTGIVDAPDFEFDVDRGPDSTSIEFNVEPLSKVTLLFTIGDSLDSSTLFSKNKDTIQKSKVIRKTGNPIADMIFSGAIKDNESSFYPIEIANYPRETGNPIADIALLRNSGIQGI